MLDLHQDTQSRNYTVGTEIGQGKRLEDIMARMKMIAEGVYTAESAHALASKHAIEMPIVREIYLVLFENKHPRQALEDLMGRDLKAGKTIADMHVSGILSRYIFKELLWPFLLALLVFSSVALMTSIIDLMDLIFNKGISPARVLMFIIYLLPSLLIYTVPMSVMLAVLIALGRLSADTEIIALKPPA